MNEPMDELTSGLQEETAKLRALATGNRELEAVAQVLSHVTAALAEVDRRLQSLAAAQLELPSSLPADALIPLVTRAAAC